MIRKNLELSCTGYLAARALLLVDDSWRINLFCRPDGRAEGKNDIQPLLRESREK